MVALLVLAAAAPAASAAGTSPGQIYAFGTNFAGELGNTTNNGTFNENPTPTLVTLPGATGSAKLLATGEVYSLAVTATGQLFSWGYNFDGQLGYATNDLTDNPNPTPTQVSLPGASGPPSVVATGINYSLVLTTTGQLYTFGDNDFGENGYAADGNPHPTPILVTLPGANGPVIEVAAGENSSLALTATGQVFGWGDNFDGALGNATNDTIDTPNPPTQLTFPGEVGPVTHISEGADFGLAITSSGQLYTWGDNGFGQLGYPANTTPNPTPFQIALPGATGQPVKVAAGLAFSLVVTSTGQLFGFGANDEGQLGSTPDGNAHPTPTLISLPGAAGGVVAAAAGQDRSLAVTSSGQLYAWGDNFYGQLGFDSSGNPVAAPTIVPLPAGTTVDAVSAGPWAFHSLVLIADLAITTASLPGGQVASPYSSGSDGERRDTRLHVGGNRIAARARDQPRDGQRDRNAVCGGELQPGVQGHRLGRDLREPLGGHGHRSASAAGRPGGAHDDPRAGDNVHDRLQRDRGSSMHRRARRDD